MSAPGSSALLISNMTETETRIPSVATSGAATGAPNEDAPTTVPHTRAALPALWVECRYGGVPARPTLAAGLMSACAWLVEVTQLKGRVAGLQLSICQRDNGEDLLGGEVIARIRAAQGHLAFLSEQVATKRPYSAVETFFGVDTLAYALVWHLKH